MGDLIKIAEEGWNNKPPRIEDLYWKKPEEPPKPTDIREYRANKDRREMIEIFRGAFSDLTFYGVFNKY